MSQQLFINADEFMKWLSEQPAKLAQLMEIFQEWLEMQGEAPPVGKSESGGPRKFIVGGTVGVEIEGLSHADLDEIKKGYAEAVKKEKALEFIKGFIIGMTFLG